MNTCTVPVLEELTKKHESRLKFSENYYVLPKPRVNVYNFSPCGMLNTLIIDP